MVRSSTKKQQTSFVVELLEDVMQTFREVPYGTWRDYDPEEALRFYALRMRDVGMLKGTPQQIIANGTDWRFLNELKRELKA